MSALRVLLPRHGARDRSDERWRGQVLYSPDVDAVIAVESRSAGGAWRCAVIGRRTAANGAGHVDLPPAELASGETVVDVDPIADRERYVMVWRALVWCHRGGGRTWSTAGALVCNALVEPLTLVALTPVARQQVIRAVNLRTEGLYAVVSRLIAGGFLSAAPALREYPGEVYQLTIPTDYRPSGNGE